MKDAIQARIEELERYRARLIAETSAELQRVMGGIAELQLLKNQLEAQPETEPAQEAGSIIHQTE